MKLVASIMLSSFAISRTAAFVTRQSSRAISVTSSCFAAEKGQAEVVLVGCGAPNRGMGWYHGIQMLEKK